MQLNLNPCSNLEFNCNDARCVPLAWRCDGVTDCKPGGEDEKECGILVVDDSYVAAIPPWPQGDSEINMIKVSVTIMDIQEVNILDGIVKAYMETRLNWTDAR